MSVFLVIGVNGVGKTTSVGKLASTFKARGKKVLLAAADTFRAGAIEQLKVWAERSGVDIIAQAEGSDPAAVVFDSVQAAKARDVDILIADTAGRLHNKKNLMNELSKINRVIDREYPGVYRENLIVLDATTGQNAIQQLREFNDVTDITGIILTKMDGTAKGGIVVAIQAEFGIPVKYIGVGEKIEDLQKFDSNSFVEALFDDSDTERDDSEEEEAAEETNSELPEELESEDRPDDTGDEYLEADSVEKASKNTSEDEEELSAFELGQIFKDGMGDILSANNIDISDSDNNAEEDAEKENTADKNDNADIVYDNTSGTENSISEQEEFHASDNISDTENTENIAEVVSEDLTNDEDNSEEPKKKKGFFSWFRK